MSFYGCHLGDASITTYARNSMCYSVFRTFECLAHLLIYLFLSMNLQLLGQLQKNTTRAVFPPCPNAVCRNPLHFKVILSHFDFILVPWGALGDPWGALGDRRVLRRSRNRFLLVWDPFWGPSGRPLGNLFGPCGHPEGPRTEKTTHCKVSVRGLDFWSDFLHFSGALDP